MRKLGLFVACSLLVSCINDSKDSEERRNSSSSVSGEGSSCSVSVSSSSEGNASSAGSVSSSSAVLQSSSSVSWAGWGDCVQSGNCGTFKDERDGRVYRWVTIGTQVWMAENLAYLPEINAPMRDKSDTEPMYYVFDYPKNYNVIYATKPESLKVNVEEAKASQGYAQYGVYYNRPAALNACPRGWHLPTSAEWSTLGKFVEGSYPGEKLKIAGWGGDTTYKDSFGFSAIPAGKYSGYFYGSNPGAYDGGAFFWCSNASRFEGVGVYVRIGRSGYIEVLDGNYRDGYSVRCVRDE